MSRENVEVARRAYETFSTRDISGWLALHSADAELHDQNPNLLDDAVRRGHREMRTWAEGVIEITEYLRFEPQRFTEAGEFVLVHVRISAKGRVGGVPTEMSIFHVFEFSDGKIRRLWSYASEDQAVEAVGLRE
jgi:ketosteroid isomerase-like protein